MQISYRQEHHIARIQIRSSQDDQYEAYREEARGNRADKTGSILLVPRRSVGGKSDGAAKPEEWAGTWVALLEWGAANGVDWLIGRRLPGLVSELRLGRAPLASTDVQNIRGTDRGAKYFQLFFAEVRDRVLASGTIDASTFDAASALLDDPDYWTQCWMMTAVWAQKSTAAKT